MKPIKSGNATITIDDSYVNSRTDEQRTQDLQNLREAMWPIIDELNERGESIPA